MIELVDKEVCICELAATSREQVIAYFCQTGHSEDVLCVMKEGSYLGYIRWKNVLKCMAKDVEDWIATDHITAGPDIIDQAKEYFALNPDQKIVMVLNREGEPEAFAERSFGAGHDLDDEAAWDMVLTTMERYPEQLNIQKVYPKIAALCLHGCNEWTVRLYHIAKAQNIGVFFSNRMKWQKCVGVEESEEEIPEWSILHIYTETYPQSPPRTMESIRMVAHFCAHEYMHMLQEKLGEDRLKILRFPWVMEPVSLAEHYCMVRSIRGPYTSLKNELDVQAVEQISGMQTDQIAKHMADVEKRNLDAVAQKEIYGDVLANSFGEGKHTVWLVGPCIVEQTEMEVQESLAGQLYQRMVNCGMDYRIHSIVCNEADYEKIVDIMSSIPLRGRDIIVYFERSEEIELLNRCGKASLDLTEWFRQRPQSPAWVYNMSFHLTSAGNEALAREIFDEVIQPAVAERQKDDDRQILKGEILTKAAKKELGQWLDQVRSEHAIPENALAGAIVMNCNPFTMGHRYLVEEALKKVDYLYLFVVEEDRSRFPFEERYRMVCEGVKDLPNVCAVPSGRFVLSASTFTAYFEKEQLQEETVDAAMDLEIFARYVAPGLHISKRFVGEEPTDRVTYQYNRQMQKMMMEYGIDVIEIPRKECGGQVISASTVRKCMDAGDWEMLERILPESSLKAVKAFKSRGKG